MFDYLKEKQRDRDFYQAACSISSAWEAGDYENCCLWCKQGLVIGIKQYLHRKELSFLDTEDLLYFANKSPLTNIVTGEVRSGILFVAIICEMLSRKDASLCFEDYAGCLRGFDTFAKWLYNVKAAEPLMIHACNCKEEVLECALDYLASDSYSKKKLLEQLMYEGFTKGEAEYGVEAVMTDWNEQAFRCAKDYYALGFKAKQELMEQLESEGFTKKEAKQAVARIKGSSTSK